MKSIRSRLLFAFFGVIAILSISSVVFYVLNSIAVRDYKSISNTMIAGYRSVDNASILIDAFNVRLQSAGTDNSESIRRIEQAESEIKKSFLILDSGLKDTISKSNYIGFKSSVEKLVMLIDSNIEKFEKEGIKDYFADYNEVNKQYGFVRDNGSTLIFSQLKYSSSIQDSIDRTYFITTLLGLASTIIVLLGCIFFVFRFAKKLITPLVKLTFASKNIASGNMDFKIDKSILEKNDETGVLAKSFQDMTEKLNVLQLGLKNKAIESEARAIEIGDKLSQIEKMNKLMVDRELKMIELKKEVETLKGQISKK